MLYSSSCFYDSIIYIFFLIIILELGRNFKESYGRPRSIVMINIYDYAASNKYMLPKEDHITLNVRAGTPQNLKRYFRCMNYFRGNKMVLHN